MSHITRKPGESIQTPLYRLKTCYEMLIQINYPDLDVGKIKICADNYAINCAKFLITPNTAKILTEYIGIKQQRGEHLNLMKLCNVITSHEAGNSNDRIQQVVTLPAAAINVNKMMHGRKAKIRISRQMVVDG